MNDTTALPYVQRPAGHGLVWLRASFAMFAAARVRWLVLLLLYYVVLGVVKLIPVVSLLAVPLLTPIFSVGFLAAAWSQERGGLPRPADLFRGFRANVGALLALGAFLTVGMTLATFASALIDGGRLLALFNNPPALDADARDAADRVESVLTDGRVQLGMLFAVLCAIPVLLAMWFAPALVVFQDCRAPRALRTSLRASLGNWRALAVYALAVFVLLAVVPTFLATIVALLSTLGGDALRIALSYVILLPYIAMVMVVTHIADYVAYRDVFHPGETLAPVEGASPS